MRHLKHRNQLGVKKEHRIALTANLASALIKEGRITTTLKKAKALRPFAEKLVTLAKKGTLHHRRLAIARVRDREAVRILFDERASAFSARNGGYTRIYKTGARIGDAAEMAIIEWVGAEDTGYQSTRRKSGKKAAKPTPAAAAAAEAAVPVEEAPESDAPESGEPGPADTEHESSDTDRKEEK